MATLNALTLDVLEMLYGADPSMRPREDTLYSAVAAAGTTSFRMTTPALWDRGDFAEYWPGTGAEAEIVQFAEKHKDYAATSVRRSQRRTTAAGGFSAGDVFLKNPPWPAITVRRAITETIDNDLSPDIWYRSDRTATLTAGQHRYEANAYDYLIEDMYQFDLNSSTTHDPFPVGWSELIPVSTSEETTGKALMIYRWYDTDETVYYRTRTRVDVDNIADFPSEVADMIPWGACARLLPSMGPPARLDPSRSGTDYERPSQPYTDAEYFRARFEDMKRQYRKMLLRERNISPRFRRNLVVRG